jgi:hypothetical protein
MERACLLEKKNVIAHEDQYNKFVILGQSAAQEFFGQKRPLPPPRIDGSASRRGNRGIPYQLYNRGGIGSILISN